MTNSIRYEQDPVYMQPDGQWCFKDITLTGFFGPYPDQATAYKTLNEYLVWLSQQQQPQQAAPQPDVAAAMESATAEFMALRAKKAAISEEFKTQLSAVEDDMAKIEAKLLDFLNTTGLKNFSTTHGVVYTEAAYQPQLGDKGAFLDFVRDARMPELLQARVSSTALKQYIENGNEMPPGIKVNQERVVRVRAN